MRLLILSRNPQLYSTSRLVLSARGRGHDVTVADPLEFQLVISKGRPSIFLGERPLPKFDLVIPRIGASITNYGLAVVRQFDLLGIPVLNDSGAIARSRDKLRAMQILANRGIDVPITVCAKTPNAVNVALNLVGVPAIIKLQQGAQGIGTMIAETPQAALSLLETLITNKSYSMMRVIMLGAGEMPDVALEVYEAGPLSARRQLAAFLKAETELGRMKVEDCDQAAEFFSGMVMGQSQMRSLLRLPSDKTAEEYRRLAREAAVRFMRAYAV